MTTQLMTGGPRPSKQHAGTASTTDATVAEKSRGEYLVHRHALRQVAREVRVDASQQGQFVSEELQRQHR